MKELAYRKVYRLLREAILEGKYPVGSFLPTEPELEEIYQVSRTTIRKAASMLAEKGLVEIRQGRGTLVLEQKVTQSYDNVNSIEDVLQRYGYEISIQSQHIDTIFPDEEIRREMEIHPADELVRIQRICTADGVPICLSTDYIPARLVPGMEHETKIFESLYRHLEEEYDLDIYSTRNQLTAVGADLAVANLLGKPVGYPLLHIKRICVNGSYTPICMNKVQILGDRYTANITTIRK